MRALILLTSLVLSAQANADAFSFSVRLQGHRTTGQIVGHAGDDGVLTADEVSAYFISQVDESGGFIEFHTLELDPSNSVLHELELDVASATLSSLRVLGDEPGGGRIHIELLSVPSGVLLVNHIAAPCTVNGNVSPEGSVCTANPFARRSAAYRGIPCAPFSIADLAAWIDQMDLPRGIARALDRQIAAAQRAEDEGRMGAAIRRMEVLARIISAQDGHQIAEGADVLLDIIDGIIDGL